MTKTEVETMYRAISSAQEAVSALAIHPDKSVRAVVGAMDDGEEYLLSLARSLWAAGLVLNEYGYNFPTKRPCAFPAPQPIER